MQTELQKLHVHYVGYNQSRFFYFKHVRSAADCSLDSTIEAAQFRVCFPDALASFLSFLDTAAVPRVQNLLFSQNLQEYTILRPYNGENGQWTCCERQKLMLSSCLMCRAVLPARYPISALSTKRSLWFRAFSVTLLTAACECFTDDVFSQEQCPEKRVP